VCRLKQLGLSTTGNKKALQGRLALHMDSTAGGKQSAPSPAAEKLAGRSAAGPSSKLPAGKGVFKAQKRKNFVRINLKVSFLVQKTWLGLNKCTEQLEVMVLREGMLYVSEVTSV
jgi:hypothetical protein